MLGLNECFAVELEDTRVGAVSVSILSTKLVTAFKPGPSGPMDGLKVVASSSVLISAPRYGITPILSMAEIERSVVGSS